MTLDIRDTVRDHPVIASIERQVGRIATLKPREFGGLLASFLYFFALLTAYYILRPLREEMGTMLRAADPDALKDVFVFVFGVMLLAVPLFGWVVSRFEKRHVVPIVYLFFISHLLVFWMLMSRGAITPTMAKAFFVWVSVFNLFVISLFWSVMSSFWNSDQAKRLYGIVAAGGTVGALTGPLITQTFASILGPTNLLLVAAVFLILSLAIAVALPRMFASNAAANDNADAKQAVTVSSMLRGARRVWDDPFLFRLAMWVLLANLISTFFYFEQARIVGDAITDRTARVELFARIDLSVSILTMLAQIFGTAKIIERFGLGVTTASLPLAAMLGFLALAIAPTLAVIVAIVVVERAIHFSFSSPAARVLWTIVDEDDKYKAQNFVDTVVYRGGDAASGWFFDALGKGLGMGTAGIAIVTLPLAAAWCLLSFDLANRFQGKTTAPGRAPIGPAQGKH
jgi:AAA family ATP:ADP antiporter